MIERQRSVIAIEDSDHPAMLDDPRRLLERRQWLFDMAQQGMCNKRVECSIREIEPANIPGAKFQVSGKSFLASQARRRRHQVRTEIHAGNTPRESGAACDSSGRQPGPAAHVE